ncbi:methyltransferase, FxLD system [Actinospica sp. MGRD01-02]|uniref:Protein-L-isoaspartate O-methyltransferase n=1 Tax=Actinospica acidithermotolerans TaxID=2828514 RepID=A0A941IHL4_9ACTN|nr:methyltransferase, FxLD system [Actinospica acidithermotolerans]MBR7825837.1 methyltransferase, FxLD system [Actinospica acidithermotolerans]
MTQEPAVEQGAPELRTSMVDQLLAHGSLTSARLAAAMREVPRHLFTPGANLTAAYAVDEVVRYRTDEHGVCLSSVSAPWIQAEMIEAAGIEDGMRVLEVGSGGYNAALLSRLVGPAGRVVSVDIDPEAIERAAAGLAAAGIGGVELVLADAEHGVPAFAPYDRVIVTVAAWEVAPAWVAQLAEGGRIVLPLVMRGQQRIIAFERDGADLVSRKMIYGGFVPMQGAGARKAFALGLDDAATLHFDEGGPVDAGLLRTVLDNDPVTAGSGVSVARQEPYDSLQLYLAAVLPSTASLVFASPGAGRDLPDPQAGFPVFAYGGGTIAYMTVRQHGEGDAARFELVACGLGPDAANAAAKLRDLVRAWDRELRAERLQPQVTIAFAAQSVVPGSRRHLLAKTRSTLVLCYPEPSAPAGGAHESAPSIRSAS